MSKTKSVRNPYLLPQGEKEPRKDESAAVSELSLIQPMQICWDQSDENK